MIYKQISFIKFFFFLFTDEEPILFCTEDTKYYALRLERSIHETKYVQPAENWWATSPPIQSNQDSRSIMIC